MKVGEVLERIKFNAATVNDLTGKAANNLFSNRNILQQLKFALDKYAIQTQAIEYIHTAPVSDTTKYLPQPKDILRTQAYKLGLLYVQGRIYNLRFTQDAGLINTYFPYEIIGLPRFLYLFQDQIYIFPTSSYNYYTTNLTKPVSKTDTEIHVENANSFPQKDGYVQIGEEKIKYKYYENNVLYQCERGNQFTIPESYPNGTEMIENNLHIFCYKKHFEIPIFDNEFISPEILNMDMEVCDEHIEVITDYTSYKLLSKVDANRAEFYKVNFDEWLTDTKYRVKQGRELEVSGENIPQSFWWETNAYLGYGF